MPLTLLGAFFVAALLTVAYQIVFLAAMLVSRRGFGELDQLPRTLSAWWPDPAAVGIPFYLYAMVAVEPVVFNVFFFGALALAYWLRVRRVRRERR